MNGWIGLRVRLEAHGTGRAIGLHATDTSAIQDLPAGCRMTGHPLLHHDAVANFCWIAPGGCYATALRVMPL